jgi:hypothetical protein
MLDPDPLSGKPLTARQATERLNAGRLGVPAPSQADAGHQRPTTTSAANKTTGRPRAQPRSQASPRRSQPTSQATYSSARQHPRTPDGQGRAARWRRQARPPPRRHRDAQPGPAPTPAQAQAPTQAKYRKPSEHRDNEDQPQLHVHPAREAQGHHARQHRPRHGTGHATCYGFPCGCRARATRTYARLALRIWASSSAC